MKSRYRLLALYSLVLAALAGTWLQAGLAGASDFPPIWIAALAIAFNLFVWQLGIPAPWVGLTSMERLPQIGLLLVFSTPVAAAICALASLLWPLLNRRYSHGSLTVATLRAVHNAGMTALMLMAAGYVYEVTGGRHPLEGLGVGDIVPLLAMALTAQAVNVALMALFYRFDGRDVRGLIKPMYSIMDLVFVPAGVLAATLYNAGEPAIFALFVALMMVFVLSFNGIGRALTTADAERSPLGKLFQAGRALHGARSVDDLGERILAQMRPLFRFDEFYLVLVDPDQRTLELRVHELHGELRTRRRKPIDAGWFGRVVERAQPLLVDDWARAPEELRERSEETEKTTGSLIAAPLIERGAVIGLLGVQHTRTGVYSTADLHLMQQLAGQVAAAVADARAFEDLEDYRARLEERVAERTSDLEKANREKERLIGALRERSSALERESQEDPLTGIANRRHFARRLAAEFEVALAVGQPLTLAIADLDRFKIVNDRLGHKVGDETLRRSAALMRGLCRESDLVARIGGEEFALILPATSRAAAADLCEALRVAVESHDWHTVHPHLRVTVSIGLAQWDGVADSTELLDAADTQLYRAKRAGRNRVA